MGKRGAAKSAGPKAKAQKVAAKEDAVVEEVAEVNELVAMAEGLPESCRDMLIAMAPHSLKKTEGERHEYQEKMNKVLAALFSSLEDERAATVSAVEAQIAEVETEKAGASAMVETAAEKEATETAVRDAKAQASDEAEKAAEAAQVAVTEAKEKVQGFEAEQKGVTEEKEQHIALAGEKMEQLKTGSFPGRLWRERDRVIGEFVKALQGLSPDEASLRDAFAAAMKVKPDARGAFATKAIEFAEGLLAKHIAELTEKLASGEAEAARRAEAVTAAEAALKDAQQRRDEAQEEYIAADNNLLEATEAKNAATRVLAGFEPKMAELRKALKQAKDDLEAVQLLIARFDELRKGALPPVAAEEKPEEEPAAEAAMVVDEPAA